MAAHGLLKRVMTNQLIAAAEHACQEPVRVTGVSVSLFGSLQIDNLQVSDMFAAESVEVGLSLSALLNGEIHASEIVIDHPNVNLHDRSQRLRQLISRLSQRHAQALPDAKAQHASNRWPHIRVRQGTMRIDAGDHAQASLFAVTVRPTKEGRLRIAFGPSTFSLDSLKRVGLTTRAMLASGAADIDLQHMTVTRFIGRGGTLRIHGPGREQALGATDLEVSYGARDPSRGQLQARIGSGRVAIRGFPDALDVSIYDVPVQLINPLFSQARFDRGHVSGNLSIRVRPNQSISGPAAPATLSPATQSYGLTGSIALDKVVARIDWLEQMPVQMSPQWIGAAIVTHNESEGWRADISELQMRLGEISATVAGTVHLPTQGWPAMRADLSLMVVPLPCAAMVASTPKALLGPLHGVRVSGHFAGGARLKIQQPNSRPVELDIDLANSNCHIRTDAPLANVAALARNYHHMMPNGRRVILTSDSPEFIALDTLPSYVASAFIAAEDARFRSHHGFDSRQIENSIAKDLAKGRLARGGSTISQQLAKNLFLSRERTLGRKLKEAVLAWRIEEVLDKDSILEIYLNVIQLGESVYGIQAASQRWFHKEAHNLSPREAAFLASLTRSPTFSSRSIATGGGMTPEMVRRVEYILQSMRHLGAIDAPTLTHEQTSLLHLQVERVVATRR